VVCEPEPVRFAFISSIAEENVRKPRAEQIPINLACEVLGVSRQGYYAWKKREESARECEDKIITELLIKIDREHEGRYGIDRLTEELARGHGRRHSPKRVRRLARAAGLRCVHPRPYRVTTRQDPASQRGLVDLVDRQFVPGRQDQVWYGDITYIKTMSGWLYLATVIDGYSRKVVGWAIGRPHARRPGLRRPAFCRQTSASENRRGRHAHRPR
jgi:putative transposase